MKICTNCEAQNKETANFCKICGQDLRNVAPLQEPLESPLDDITPSYQSPYAQDPTERLPESSMPDDMSTPYQPPQPVYEPPEQPQYQQPQYQQPTAYQQPEQAQYQQPTVEKPSRRKLWLGLAGLFVVLLGAGAFLFFGPLNLWGRLTGGYDVVAQVMPADTELYLGFDALAVDREEATALWERFLSSADGDAEDIAEELEDSWQNFSESFEDETGLSLEEDVFTWVGQYAGVGMVNAEFGDFGLETFEWIGGIEVRDTDAADQFLEKFIEALEDEGEEINESEKDGVTIYEFEFDEVAFGRHDNLMLIGSSVDMIEDAMEAGEDVLSESSEYGRALEGLPSNRAMTLYLDQSFVRESNRTLESEADMELDTLTEGVEGQTMSMTLEDGNIRIDAAVAYNLDDMSESQRTLFESMDSDVALAEQFPEETLLFASAVRPDMVWQIFREVIVDTIGSGEFNDGMDEIENEIGFSPEDVIELLDGEMAMGIVQSREGVMYEEGGIELGVMFIADTSDGERLASFVDDFTDAADENGLPMDESDAGDARIFTAEDGYTLFSYGNSPTALLLGTGPDVIEMLYESDSSLTDNDLYTSSWALHDSGRMPMLYINLPSLLDTIEDGLDDFDLEDFRMVRSFFEPISTITWSLQPGVNEVQSQTLIIQIAEE